MSTRSLAVAKLVLDYKFADPVMAESVVIRESEGDWSKENKNANGTTDHGGWQLNDVHLGKDVNGTPLTHADMHDVKRSTEYAFILSKGGTDWTHWTPSSSVAAGQRWADIRKQSAIDIAQVRTVANLPGWHENNWIDELGVKLNEGPVGQTLDAAGNAVRAVTSPFSALIGPLGTALSVLTSRDFWKRAGLVVAGVALLALALVAVFGKDVAVGTAGAASLGTVDLDG